MFKRKNQVPLPPTVRATWDDDTHMFFPSTTPARGTVGADNKGIILHYSAVQEPYPKDGWIDVDRHQAVAWNMFDVEGAPGGIGEAESSTKDDIKVIFQTSMMVYFVVAEIPTLDQLDSWAAFVEAQGIEFHRKPQPN